MSDEVPDAENILCSLKMQGEELPFPFRNGSPLASALRGLLGKLDPKEALGLSKEMQAKDDGLNFCRKTLWTTPSGNKR